MSVGIIHRLRKKDWGQNYSQKKVYRRKKKGKYDTQLDKKELIRWWRGGNKPNGKKRSRKMSLGSKRVQERRR